MKWIVLLRGVNVGGKGRLPMKKLMVALDRSAFCNHAQYYIQSGNLVLESPLTRAAQLSSLLGELIKANFEFLPQVLAIPAGDFVSMAEENPYSDAANKDPKSVHLYFLSVPPASPDMQKLEGKKKESETFLLAENCVLYLHAPEGIGRSKLAASVEKAMGVPATARNWNTVMRLLELLDRSSN